MPRQPRKKPPKHDHVAIHQSFVARPPTEAEARTATQAWLADEGNIERLLEQVSSGQSVRRFCEQEGISYSPVQRALTSEQLEPRYRQAQQEQAEHLVGEMERITAKLERGELDPKTGSVILDNLKWRASKFNLRYNERQVIEQHQFNHTQAHIDAVRQLARMTRVVQVGDGHTKPALVHQADRTPIEHQELHSAPSATYPAQEAIASPGTPGTAKDDPGQLVSSLASNSQPGQPGQLSQQYSSLGELGRPGSVVDAEFEES